MNLLRLICLLSICCFLGAAQEVPPIPAEHPEQIGGRWETATTTGIEGIGFEIWSASKRPLGSEGEHFVWQNVNVRVYTREGGRETWGYFNAQYRLKPKTDPLPDSSSFEVFDGRHLRIHFTDTTDIKPFDLDIVFVPKSNKWIGTWSRNGKDERVTLTRPEVNDGAKPNKFVGEWIGEPSSDPADPFEPTTLNICESTDGVLSAWLDTTSSATSSQSGATHNNTRYGQHLDIESMTESTLVLKPNNSTGALYQFRGSLSANGQMLKGSWDSQGGGGRLSAAGQFRRAPIATSESSSR
jgi:hypothetical protein